MPAPSSARVHDFTVVANEPIAQGVCALRIHAPALACTLKPGQFLSLAVPGNEMSLLRIPLSFAATDAAAGTVDIWYAIVGEGTQRLSAMRPGESSTALGPGGHGWSVPVAEDTRALLVAGGIGMPPIVALARAIRDASPAASIQVIAGASTAAALTGLSELRDLGAEVQIATDDGTAGHHGFCTDLVERALQAESFTYAASCGPEPMMHKVADLTAAAGVSCEVSLERMMSCGFGACATCAVETTKGMKGACMAGPVFDAKEVVW